MHYKIDAMHLVDDNIKVEGWVLADNLDDKVQYKIVSSNGVDVSYEFESISRIDVTDYYSIQNAEAYNIGFNITFPAEADKIYYLYIILDYKKIKIKLSKKIVDNFNSFEYKKFVSFKNYFNLATFKRAFDYLFSEGISAFIDKTKRKVKGLQVDYDYDEWYKLTKTTDEELIRQKNDYDREFSFKPKYSIIIPIYDTKDRFLEKLFDSILNQTYPNFEVCIADATDYKNNKNNPTKFFEKLNDDRIKIKYLTENKTISENTNEALTLATGDYIVLCDHDDELTLDALYEFTKVLNENKNIKFIYSDEDKIDTSSSYLFEPHFKPDFNLDMLLSVNYICHLVCIDKNVVEKLISKDGSFERVGYNGAQDFDLYLRLVNVLLDEYSLDDIYHIRKVLYHWRSHNLSTSKVASSKDYAFVSGKNAILDFYKNTKLNFNEVKEVVTGYSVGLYHTVFKKIENEPRLSIIIPNKDHIDDLEKCLNSLSKSVYKNFEVVIVENNSTDENTFNYYKNVNDKYNFDIKVLYYKAEFNYSKINNFAVENTDSEYLLLLNNDIEMISENSIEEMMNYVMRDDVGIVGAKLLYPDDNIQHAGVILGFGGIAGHAFVGIHEKRTYMNRAHMVQDLTSVTAACMMTKREIYNKVNGLTEKFVVAFNDIDYCMKVRELNKLVVYNPYASFYHYESKSRGYEDTKEKVDRFNREVALFNKKWGDKIIAGDIYYNPNLTLRKSDFSLRNLKFEKIAEPYPLDDEIIKIMETLDE